MSDLRDQLREVFGLDEFRPGQREVIEDVLAGKDVLCVMPTGAGKSLCYQLPAVQQKGLTIVVSPLISLMEDQVQQLRDEGISAAVLNSALSPALRRQVMAEVEAGFEGLLYVAPERFFAGDFMALMPRLRPTLFVVDEAHCVSSWGHDFRPEYSRLGDVREQWDWPVTMALTATATSDVRKDIAAQLGLRRPSIYVTGFDRPNLRYESRNLTKETEKDEELYRLVKGESGSGIIYCATRKAVESTAEMLRRSLPGRPIFMYHGGMETEQRSQNQEGFMQTASAVCIATNAFGMGINKPDIRFVIHYNMPGTLEAYYQEAGRAGRDGRPSKCVLLFSFKDRKIQEFFIDRIGEEGDGAMGRRSDEGGMDPEKIVELKQHARDKLDLMLSYARTFRCRRQMILDYFGDATSQVSDCVCDACRAGKGDAAADEGIDASREVDEETTTLVRKLLSAVARLKGQFGAATVAECLAGSENDRMLRWRLHDLSVYGLLKQYQVKQIVAMLHRMMESGLARQRDPDGMKFRPIVELTALGAEVMKGAQKPPPTLADLVPRGRSAYRASGGRTVRAIAEDVEQLSGEAAVRFERLRAMRSRLAREKGMPAYVICHDSVLKSIAARSPADVMALGRIKGMGPAKVSQYGEAILGALREGGEQMSRKIVVIGSINMDLVCRCARMPRAGETVSGLDLLTIPGGKGANQAVAAARLATAGDEVHMVGRAGEDDFGERLLVGLRGHGVRADHVTISEGVSTGCAVIMVDQAGENSIVLSPGANAKLSVDDVDAAADLITSAAVVVMQLEVPAATVERAIAVCRRAGVRTILDPAPAPAKGLSKALFQVDVLTPNQTEAEALLANESFQDPEESDPAGVGVRAVGTMGRMRRARRVDAKQLGEELLERGPGRVILKLGAKGAMIVDGEIEHVNGYKVKVVDTTAAGDAFTGALAVGLAEGMEVGRAVRFANAAGARCCETFGAQPALPRRIDVESLMGGMH